MAFFPALHLFGEEREYSINGKKECKKMFSVEHLQMLQYCIALMQLPFIELISQTC